MKTNLNNFLFIGDSFTERLASTIRSNNDHVYICALGGTTPGYWIDRVSKMPNDVEAIILLIGTNGILNESNITDAKVLINNICKKYPQNKIFIQKVFPVGKNFYENKAEVLHRIDAVNRYNDEIKNFCNDKKNITIIDTRNGLVDEEGYLKFTDDELHIAEKYNQFFYENIFKAVKIYY